MLESNISVKRGDFVARFGGDEFLIVCRKIAPQALKRRLEEVALALEKCSMTEALTEKIEISGGCVCLSEFPNMSAVELINQADKRLYKAKENGRRQICGG